MSNWLRLYFVFSVILGTTIYVFQITGFKLPEIINNFVNDFLIIPIVLTICLFILRKTKNNPNYKIPLSIILYLCVLYSVLFEFILPNYLVRYTKDYIDILLYFAGGMVFYQLQKIDI